MNKHLFLLIFLSLSAARPIFAQPAVEKYCFLKCFGHLGKPNSARIELTFGQTDSLFTFTDTTIIPRLKRVESFHDLPDAFNYFSLLGWEIAMPSFQANTGPNIITVFCFRKAFTPAELGNK